jgi:arylsulfatase A-like enzyme
MRDKVGPRNILHCLASDVDDPTVDPRWGKVGKQKITDEGPLPPHPISGIKYNMETVDEVIRDKALEFNDKARQADKPFFVWLNPTRMHAFTHLSEKYQNMRTPENGRTIEEGGMAQLDDVVGAVMQKLRDLNIENNTILVFSADSGAENFTWPDGGQTPFAGGKGTAPEGGFRVPCIIRWLGRVSAGSVENGIMSGLDWFPTFAAAAGNPNVIEELLKGKQLGDRSYQVHLDGYNQLDFITGKAPSQRHEVFYFTEGTLSAVRIDEFKYRFTDQPNGWFGGTVKVDWPFLINLRLDPFERTGLNQSIFAGNWWGNEFWRFVYVQEQVGSCPDSD